MSRQLGWLRGRLHVHFHHRRACIDVQDGAETGSTPAAHCPIRLTFSFQLKLLLVELRVALIALDVDHW